MNHDNEKREKITKKKKEEEKKEKNQEQRGRESMHVCKMKRKHLNDSLILLHSIFDSNSTCDKFSLDRKAVF